MQQMLAQERLAKQASEDVQAVKEKEAEINRLERDLEEARSSILRSVAAQSSLEGGLSAQVAHSKAAVQRKEAEVDELKMMMNELKVTVAEVEARYAGIDEEKGSLTNRLLEADNMLNQKETETDKLERELRDALEALGCHTAREGENDARYSQVRTVNLELETEIKMLRAHLNGMSNEKRELEAKLQTQLMVNENEDRRMNDDEKAREAEKSKAREAEKSKAREAEGERIQQMIAIKTQSEFEFKEALSIRDHEIERLKKSLLNRSHVGNSPAGKAPSGVDESAEEYNLGVISLTTHELTVRVIEAKAVALRKAFMRRLSGSGDVVTDEEVSDRADELLSNPNPNPNPNWRSAIEQMRYSPRGNSYNA